MPTGALIPVLAELGQVMDLLPASINRNISTFQLTMGSIHLPFGMRHDPGHWQMIKIALKYKASKVK